MVNAVKIIGLSVVFAVSLKTNNGRKKLYNNRLAETPGIKTKSVPFVERRYIMMKDECRLTVFCISYNFGDYIKDALEGFLKQKTDFKFKVFIYDDASTDCTGDILREYANRYPDFFDIFISPKNTYNDKDRNIKLQQLRIEHQEGEYIAICEGDDYWVDELKLQKQVDFLDANPQCSLVVHASHWIDWVSGEEYDVFPYHESKFLSAEEVITQPGGNPPTASYVYRARDLIVDQIFHRKDVVDYTRQLYELTKGDVYYMNEVMSVYRHCHGGSWTEKYYSDKLYAMRHFFDMQNFLTQYDRYTGGQHHKFIRLKFFEYLYDAMLRDPDVEYEEYERIISESGLLEDENLTKYKNVRKRLGAIVRGTYVFNEKEKDLLKGKLHVVIYGCGVYSKSIINCLEKNEIEWDGFVVSDNQDVKEKKNKPVWRLCDYPYSFEDSAVVIGVGQNLELVVKEALEEKKIHNVVECFWVHEEDLI